jgi:hypothetical protein
VRPGRALAIDQQIAPADIDIVFQLEDNAERGKRFFHFPAAGFDAGDAAGQARWQCGDHVAFAPGSAGDLAGIAAVIMQGFGLRPDDILYRQPAAGPIDILFDFRLFQQFQQGRAFIPGDGCRPI